MATKVRVRLKGLTIAEVSGHEAVVNIGESNSAPALRGLAITFTNGRQLWVGVKQDQGDGAFLEYELQPAIRMVLRKATKKTKR